MTDTSSSSSVWWGRSPNAVLTTAFFSELFDRFPGTEVALNEVALNVVIPALA